MIQKAVGSWVVALGLVLLPLPASATFHLMKIMEVFPGSAADPAAQYIMLQMYAGGQNFVAGHSVEVFDASGASTGAFTFGADVANGASGATILIATPDAVALFGIPADLTMTAAIQASGGAACWGAPFTVDCVAWGDFSAAATLPVSPGTPFNASTGLVFGQAMQRSFTNSFGSTTDFILAAPAPKNNAGQSGTLLPGATDTPTPTVTPEAGGCVGDCDGNGQVTVDEVVKLVSIALGDGALADCSAGDANHDGRITIDEILKAVDDALGGCGLPQVVPTDTPTAVPAVVPPTPPPPDTPTPPLDTPTPTIFVVPPYPYGPY